MFARRTMDEKLQQQVQEKYMLYQIHQQGIQELQNQLALIERRQMELEATGHALEDLNGKEGDVIINLGSGVYIAGKTGMAKGFLLDVGSGIFAKRMHSNVMKIIEQRKEELLVIRLQLQQQLENIVDKANTLVSDIQELSRKADNS